MKQWNSAVFLTAIATLIALLLMGMGTVPAMLAQEAPPYYWQIGPCAPCRVRSVYS